MKEFILGTLLVITFIIVCVAPTIWWVVYKYNQCINVGFEKTYCIVRTFIY